ncbi:MAG: hypothetical protein GXY54_09525 [Deltaproteobacteria bacterium]|nr:hypothetical protein [Deltaproteobacteria bacterium]
MKFLRHIWQDLKSGENIDVYVTLLLAIGLSVASKTGVGGDMVPSLTLAILAMVVIILFGTRRRIDELAGRLSEGRAFLVPRRPDLEERLRNARTVSINGITLAGTSAQLLAVLKDCFTRGGRVRLLLMDPDHHALEIAGFRFYKHQDQEKLRREVRHALDNFETLLPCRRTPEDCQIGLLPTLPPYGIWLIDADTPKAEIWVEVYSFKDVTQPTFHLLPNRDEVWFEFFRQQFERMWESRIPWDPTKKEKEIP